MQREVGEHDRPAERSYCLLQEVELRDHTCLLAQEVHFIGQALSL